VHYGLAASTYETAVDDEELKYIKRQMVFSFFPAAAIFGCSSLLLFA